MIQVARDANEGLRKDLDAAGILAEPGGDQSLDLARRRCGRQDTEPCHYFEAGQAALGDRGQIRHHMCTLCTRHSERLDLSGANERRRGGRIGDGGLDTTCHQVDHRQTAPLVGHVADFHARHSLEHFHAQVDDRANTARGVHQLLRVGVSNEFLDRPDRKRRRDDEQVRLRDHERNRGQFIRNIDGNGFQQHAGYVLCA